MANKKISEEQFLLDCINKQFEIVGSSLHWDTFKELCDWARDNGNWYNKYRFTSPEQYEAWHSYFITHFFDWQPKYLYSKKRVEEEFSWFNLEYGFCVDYKK